MFIVSRRDGSIVKKEAGVVSLINKVRPDTFPVYVGENNPDL